MFSLLRTVSTRSKNVSKSIPSLYIGTTTESSGVKNGISVSMMTTPFETGMVLLREYACQICKVELREWVEQAILLPK